MRKAKMILLLTVLATGCLFAQFPPGPVMGPVTVTPADPVAGDSLLITFDASLSNTTFTAGAVIMLHWGINSPDKDHWILVPEEIRPEGTVVWTDTIAVRSPLINTSGSIWQIKLATLDTMRTLHFCLTDGTNWDSNGGTNYVIYFGGWPPPPLHSDNLSLTVLVDLSNAIQNRGFSPGDTVEVRAGYMGSASELRSVMLRRQGSSTIYKAIVPGITTTLHDTLYYTYFAKKNAKDNWEVYYNFEFQGETQSNAQYRMIVPDTSKMTVADTVRVQSASRRMPFFRNTKVIQQDMTVTLTCDVRPAYYHLLLGGAMMRDIQGSLNVTSPEQVFERGVAVNGPITGSWSNSIGTDWGAHLMTLDNKKMWDDGTHGDVTAGDSVFSNQYHFYKDSSATLGQEFKFGIGGGDTEGGFGNNHVENIDDQYSTCTIAAQFGSIDPYFYEEWNYDTHAPSGTAVEGAERPLDFNMAQNYPNPFNPVTRIEYTIPKMALVRLSVYNMLGQEIAVLVDRTVQAGRYEAVWNGRDHSGRLSGSGLYFAKITAPGYSKTMKMMLLK